MAKYHPITPLFTLILADTDTSVPLPNGPAGGGQPIAEGFEFIIVDNNGKAGSTNIAITGPIAGGSTGTSITTNYGSAWFRWDGATFHQK